jgi:hypothetical protein
MDGDLRIMVYETNNKEVIWQKVVMPDDAAFLSMDIDEALREIRHRMPMRSGD